MKFWSILRKTGEVSLNIATAAVPFAQFLPIPASLSNAIQYGVLAAQHMAQSAPAGGVVPTGPQKQEIALSTALGYAGVLQGAPVDELQAMRDAIDAQVAYLKALDRLSAMTVARRPDLAPATAAAASVK